MTRCMYYANVVTENWPNKIGKLIIRKIRTASWAVDLIKAEIKTRKQVEEICVLNKNMLYLTKKQK